MVAATGGARRRSPVRVPKPSPDGLWLDVVNEAPRTPCLRLGGPGTFRQDKRVSASLLVQRLWCHVEVAWPSDGARLCIYTDLRKKRWATQRLQYPRPLLRREVNVTYSAIVEQ